MGVVVLAVAIELVVENAVLVVVVKLVVVVAEFVVVVKSIVDSARLVAAVESDVKFAELVVTIKSVVDIPGLGVGVESIVDVVTIVVESATETQINMNCIYEKISRKLTVKRVTICVYTFIGITNIAGIRQFPHKYSKPSRSVTAGNRQFYYLDCNKSGKLLSSAFFMRTAICAS